MIVFLRVTIPACIASANQPSCALPSVECSQVSQNLLVYTHSTDALLCNQSSVIGLKPYACSHPGNTDATCLLHVRTLCILLRGPRSHQGSRLQNYCWTK